MSRKLNQQDKSIIREFYDQLLAAGKEEAKQVGWRDHETQLTRYRVLSEIGDMTNSTILDVGCGLCGFHEFLSKKNIVHDYTGYEIHEKMFQAARKKFKHLRIHNRDFLNDTDSKNYDYIIMAGVLSLKLTENEKYIRAMLENALKRCNIGVAANFMGTYVDYQDDYLYYADPAQIFKLGKEITNRVVIRYDYMPYEFVLYLYKEDFPSQFF